jgi:hypothetical protein
VSVGQAVDDAGDLALEACSSMSASSSTRNLTFANLIARQQFSMCSIHHPRVCNAISAHHTPEGLATHRDENVSPLSREPLHFRMVIWTAHDALHSDPSKTCRLRALPAET